MPTQFGGQNMPTSNTENSLRSPVHQRAMPVQPSPFNQYANPSPYFNANEMTVYSSGSHFTASPAQTTTSPVYSPYPEFRPIQRPPSTTSSTEFIESMNDPPPPSENAEYEEFLAWKREMHRRREVRAQASQSQQIQQQQLQNSGNMSYSGPAGQMLPRQPGHMQPIYHSGNPYGFPYENLGHAHGLPGQRTQNMTQMRSGHCYGPVNIKGDARVMRGNVVDSARPMMKSKDHLYAELSVEGKALLWDGDQTVETANTFWGFSQQGQIK